ncbi:MAG: hypothetical protein K5865_08830 [Eubacterium sp.]|nr:hypothetical protein [Eubacterium sp.]
MKKVILAVVTLAVLGLLTLGCVKVIEMNNEANAAYASVIEAAENKKEYRKAEPKNQHTIKVEDKEIIGSEEDIYKVKPDNNQEQELESCTIEEIINE